MISDPDLEVQLRFVRAHAAGSLAGVFGPDSVTWRVNREAAIFLGAGRALLLQLGHPWVATAVAEHSRFFADPIGRFHRTFKVMFTIVFGTLDQALGAARLLRWRHAAITGVMPMAVGPLSRVFAAMFGIPQASLPSSWEDFAAYNQAMWESEMLTVIPEARAVAEQILKGTKVCIRTPKWYRAVTARMLPPRLRTAFRLPYGETEQRIAESAIASIRRVYSGLPERLRYVGLGIAGVADGATSGEFA